ncbi:RNA polymerase sigma-70 factor [Compostibacter hankyongensis]
MAEYCRLFHAYYAKLHRYAFTMLKENSAAEDIVQTVFLKLWEKKGQLLGEEKVGSYLYKSTYNLSLNYIRDSKTRGKHKQDAAQAIDPLVDNTHDKILATDLSLRIRGVMEELPPQCRLIFLKSRVEGKKYAEIASELNISVKTIEVQIGKALKVFREKLKDYL